jgi:hypothetical protein
MCRMRPFTEPCSCRRAAPLTMSSWSIYATNARLDSAGMLRRCSDYVFFNYVRQHIDAMWRIAESTKASLRLVP